MEIEVVTDAVWSYHGSERAPFLGEARRFALHDEAMTKPALLYADHVTLKSGNVFVASQVHRTMLQMLMPMRASVITARWLRKPAIRDYLVSELDIPSADILSVAECDELIARLEVGATSDRTSHSSSYMLEYIAQLGGRMEASEDALMTALDAEQGRLFESGLRLAEERGVLTIQSTTDTPPHFPSNILELVAGESPLAYRDRVLDELMEFLKTTTSVVLLDPWASQVAEGANSGVSSVRRTAADAGVHLLRHLPTVEYATVSEIVDLREELRGPLVRFRAAVHEAAQEYAQSDEDTGAFIDDLRLRLVDPALADIEDAVRSNSYIGELIKVATNPKEMVLAAGTLVMAASGAVTPTATLLAAGFGVASPTLRAAMEHRKECDRIRTHKFFLLHSLANRSL